MAEEAEKQEVITKELLNVTDVAKKLSCHIMTVYKLIYSGRLKAVKIQSLGWRIEMKELEKLIGGKQDG